EVAYGKRTRLGAASAGHADVLQDVARSASWLHLERVDRTDVQALGRRTLQADLLVERASIRIGCLNGRVHRDCGVVKDPDPRDCGEALLAVDARTDHLASQTADAKAR